jgi:hypothetical protein
MSILPKTDGDLVLMSAIKDETASVADFAR